MIENNDVITVKTCCASYEMVHGVQNWEARYQFNLFATLLYLPFCCIQLNWFYASTLFLQMLTLYEVRTSCSTCWGQLGLCFLFLTLPSQALPDLQPHQVKIDYTWLQLFLFSSAIFVNWENELFIDCAGQWDQIMKTYLLMQRMRKLMSMTRTENGGKSVEALMELLNESNFIKSSCCRFFIKSFWVGTQTQTDSWYCNWYTRCIESDW